jgi:hypothetical protein
MTYIPVDLNTSSGSDAFGRARVSQPFTLFDSSFRYADNIDKWDTVETDNSGNSSYTFDSNAGLMNLTLGTSSGDQIIRETKRVFAYQPGKSLQILNTFVMNTAKANLRQRVGFFGANNGIFLEQDGTDVYFVKRNNGSDTRVAQTSWSEDTFDGTGGSGVSLDLSKAQIFWMDIEWLGVGTVRCGFVVDGVFYTCHKFHHANSITSTYMTTATLPVRYEITNTAGTGEASTLKQICSTVISEGGYTMRNITRSASTALSGKEITNATVVYPIISIRLRQNRTDAVVIPTEFNMYGIQAAAFKFVLIRGGTLTAASWTTTDSGSNVEYDISATTLTGGTRILEGIFYGQTTFNKELFEYDSTLQLTRNIGATTGNIFTLAARATTNNDDVIANLSWMEHTS